MIFVMALIGAITRLTESGLSITDWQPITGALPPLNDADWQKAFAGYQQTMQYKSMNSEMGIEAFKHIYFWEWVHRLWGRLIGVVFFLPLVGFFAAKKMSSKMFLRLLVIFALGGLQGFIGWFMVQGGLETRTSVSPYRLAMHLGFALLLYVLILWTALGNRPRTVLPKPKRGLMMHGWATLGLLCTTIVWGAFTAGLHAGFVYNTWPLMDGGLIPPGSFDLQPVWVNFFGNTGLVQFAHRWLGPTTMLAVLGWTTRNWEKADEERRKWLGALGGMAVLQVMLGLGTLLSHVEIGAAVMHQAGAITLLTLLLIDLRRFVGTTKPGK